MHIKRRARELVEAITTGPLIHASTRWRSLRRLGWERIEPCWIENNCVFQGRDIGIGEGSYINHGVHFSSIEPVSLGKRVFVGPGAKILGITHEIGEARQRAGRNISASITIGDGAWIGAGAIILPGVKIGEGCIIAAASLVKADCPPNTAWGGSPAHLIRTLE